MVETRPTSSTRTVNTVIEGGGRRTAAPAVTGVSRPTAPGRPGNRWPNPVELAALMVDGILRLPSRYRRGMFLDALV